jgi:hypothetical protein
MVDIPFPPSWLVTPTGRRWRGEVKEKFEGDGVVGEGQPKWRRWVKATSPEEDEKIDMEEVKVEGVENGEDGEDGVELSSLSMSSLRRRGDGLMLLWDLMMILLLMKGTVLQNTSNRPASRT